MPCLFTLGAILSTPGALEAIAENRQEPREFFIRHLTGDWGDVDPEDKTANDEALKAGGRLFSVYHLHDGTKIWLITEHDRSASTLLLPDEY